VGSEKRHLREDEIQEALDRRLSPEPMAAFEEHIRECPECRASCEAFAWAKDRAARAPRLSLPEGLADRIARTLDEEDARRPAPVRRPRRRALAVALAAGLAAVLVLVVLLAGRRDPVAAVARDHADLRSGRLPLALRTADVKQLEAHFARAGLGFPVRVFDLGMMRYELGGGTVRSVVGRPGALFVYHGPDRADLICEMYPGSLADLPAEGEAHDHEGIRFVVYQRDGLTLVFWPEGSVLCVLAGEGGTDVVLPLAFAKAARAAAGASVTTSGSSSG